MSAQKRFGYGAIDKKHHRVQKYKLGRARASAVKSLGELAPHALMAQDFGSSDEQFAGASASMASSNPTRSAKVKVGAAVAARRQWEASQADTRAAEEVARQAHEEQERKKELSRKRRCEWTTKCNKRTKRGQPILGLQVERYLDTLRGKAGP
jgi:hypothetical protein